MKLVLGSFVLVAAVGAGLAAQGGSDATTERTIMGCVKGDGTEAGAWTLAGVVIIPPAPVPPPGPPGGGRGARGGGGREGAPPAGREGAPPAAAGGGRGGRGAPAAPPPPPPPPQSFKLTGINMQPWANMRAEVTGTGTNADFKVANVRSMWGTCPDNIGK